MVGREKKKWLERSLGNFRSSRRTSRLTGTGSGGISSTCSTPWRWRSPFTLQKEIPALPGARDSWPNVRGRGCRTIRPLPRALAPESHFNKKENKVVQNRYNLSVSNVLFRDLGLPTVPQNQPDTLVPPDWKSRGRGFEPRRPCHLTRVFGTSYLGNISAM
jgi:hypothetical protein